MRDITIRISEKALKLTALIVTVVAVSATVLCLWSAGLFVPTYQVRLFLPKTEGLQSGAPVALDGVKIGTVRRLPLAGNQTDQNRSVVVLLRIEQRYESMIREDSLASVSTEGLLGSRYIDIRRGFAGSPIEPGGELQVVPVNELGLKNVVSAIGKAAGCQGGQKHSPD
ncbi:MAG: MlaD family protein [Candidatus Acidiferrales bacterium]